MSGRKRTKRRNSDEDFDVDEEDGGPDNDDTNKWACHSCTFMNRAAAYRCNVCGTRKGTSTRRSRVNDNVVEMQKTITNMVQKQVEKEKSIKRRERSLLTSMTRETSNGPVEVKQEPPNTFEDAESQKPTTSTSPVDVAQITASPGVASTSSSSLTETSFNKKETPTPMEVEEIQSPPSKRPPVVTINKPVAEVQQPSTSKTESPEQKKAQNPPIIVQQEAAPVSAITIPPGTPETSILQHLPERVVKKINQPPKTDNNYIIAHKRMTGIDPIVAAAEAVLLPQDWDREKVMRGLVNNYVSPATSRQSSETDSSSSDANRSLETPQSDVSPKLSKSCQIPDYMIHREAPQKLFIVANGFPAYFEEFPRRIQ